MRNNYELNPSITCTPESIHRMSYKYKYHDFSISVIAYSYPISLFTLILTQISDGFDLSGHSTIYLL